MFLPKSHKDAPKKYYRGTIMVARGTNEILETGTKEILMRCQRGTHKVPKIYYRGTKELQVPKRHQRSTTEVPMWCQRGTKEVTIKCQRGAKKILLALFTIIYLYLINSFSL